MESNPTDAVELGRRARKALAEAGRRIGRRLAWVEFAGRLRKGLPWVLLFGLATLLGLRLVAGWRDGEWMLVAGILTAWVLITAMWSWWKRPGTFRSLVIWDERSGSRDSYGSAWAYLGAGSPETLKEGEARHVSRAIESLPGSLPRLAELLPFPGRRLAQAGILSLLLLALALSPVFRPGLEAGDRLLSDEMRQAAADAAERLEREAASMEGVDDLSEEEREELEKLREEVAGVSEELAESEGKTAREVLEALEERARAAERLAEKLGAADNAWASEEMLREMSRHSDTADLAAALKDKNADLSADESDRLAGALDAESLTLEARERYTHTLGRVMEKATEEDGRKPVGERVGNASRKMDNDQPKTAAREFEHLADHFRRLAERERAQEELEKLAQQLREAGSEISGANLEQMESLAGNSAQAQSLQQGLQPLQAPSPQSLMQQLPSTQSPGSQSQSQSGAGQTGSMAMPSGPVPGSSGPQQGGGLAAPVRGQQSPAGQQGGAQGMMAGQSGQQGQPGGMLSAPIPGMAPGGSMSAPGAALGGAQSSSGGSAAAAGGLQAGNATAALGNQPTELGKAGQEATVQAQVNQNGDSTVRAIEGQARQEAAQRERQDLAIEFIQVEEQALDEKALPSSRRQHVLRYFTALRKQFEASDDAGGSGDGG